MTGVAIDLMRSSNTGGWRAPAPGTGPISIPTVSALSASLVASSRLSQSSPTTPSTLLGGSWDRALPSACPCWTTGIVPRTRLADPPHGFQRMVPQSVVLSSAPPGFSLRPLPRPPIHPPDARGGQTPQRPFEILQAGRAEGIQLLLGSFEVPHGTTLPDGGAAAPGDADAAPDS
jgi:hypothetical protein